MTALGYLKKFKYTEHANAVKDNITYSIIFFEFFFLSFTLSIENSAIF